MRDRMGDERCGRGIRRDDGWDVVWEGVMGI